MSRNGEGAVTQWSDSMSPNIPGTSSVTLQNLLDLSVSASFSVKWVTNCDQLTRLS